MRPRLLLPLLATLLGGTRGQTLVDCPDGSLTEYLTSLLDVLFHNGLTVFEDLIVTLSQSERGYTLLENIYTSPFLTLLVPTDFAFHRLGMDFPATGTGGAAGAVFALHTLQGEWGYDKLPEIGRKAVASTELTVSNGMNTTAAAPGVQGGTSGNGSGSAYQALVMQRGEAGNGMVIRMAVGNVTTWSNKLDLSAYPILDNLAIWPVDHVITFPPNLSTALGLATTSRSTSGLGMFSDALGKDTVNQLQFLTPGGFTVFAPVDDAYRRNTTAAVDAAHYTTSYTLFSPFWTDFGTFGGLILDSGDTADLKFNSSGSFISLRGGGEAMILRSDITLENGVMHIIDGVLYGPGGTGTSTSSSQALPSTSTSTSTSASTSTSGDTSTSTTPATSTSSSTTATSFSASSSADSAMAMETSSPPQEVKVIHFVKSSAPTSESESTSSTEESSLTSSVTSNSDNDPTVTETFIPPTSQTSQAVATETSASLAKVDEGFVRWLGWLGVVLVGALGVL